MESRQRTANPRIGLFSRVREQKSFLEEQRRKLDCILTHDKWVVRGYVFMVEYNGKHYLLANDKDLEVAIAVLPSKTIERMDFSHIFEVPLVRNDEMIGKVMHGVFQWACKL